MKIRMFNKLVAFLLIFTLILVGFDMPQNSNVASAREDGEKSKLFCKEKYCVSLEYKIDSSWENFYNLSIDVTNGTDADISDWSFYFPLDGEIISIWNATQEKVDNNLFCIKNAQWNRNLSKKETVNFGVIIKSDQQPQIPDLAFVCGNGEGYSISVISEDGNIWYYIDEGTKIEVLNSLSNDVYMFNIDNSCISEQVIYGGNEEKVTTYSFTDQDENDEETMIELFSLRRGKKISDGWKHNYYYQSVTDSSYYYVGCKAEYLIKNQGKSADALYNYRREIDNTRSYENAVNSACLRYGISVGVAVPLVMVNIALPETAIVSLLVVAVNGVGTSALKGIVSNCVKNYKSYNKVKDYYKTVKKYAV